MSLSNDDFDVVVDERMVERLEGDPERTICLVVTPDWLLSNRAAYAVGEQLRKALTGSRWEDVKVIVSQPGWTIQAVQLSESEQAKIDRKAML